MMPPSHGSEQEALPPPLKARPRYRWYHKAAGVVFVSFLFAMGLFLLIFPWSDLWEINYFASLVPEWHRHWENLYVRGAISGLGVVDLCISFIEMFRLRRFAE